MESLFIIAFNDLLLQGAASKKQENPRHIIHGLPTEHGSRFNSLIQWPILLTCRCHNIEGSNIRSKRLEVVGVHIATDAVTLIVKKGLLWADGRRVQLEDESGDLALRIT